MKKNFLSGFTLIELMVTITILGILSAVVISNMSVIKAKSRDHNRISDISNIQLALVAYLNRCGRYPTGDALVSGGCPNITSSPIPGDSYTDHLAKLVELGFLGKLPTDPVNSGNYVYGYYSADGTSYCLAANLETANSSVLTSTCAITGWSTKWTAGTNPYVVSKP